VTGCNAAIIRPHIGNQIEVHNPNWKNTEMKDSILLGLIDISAEAVVLLTPIDTPPPTTMQLETLLNSPLPACCGHKSKAGHPIAASCSWMKEKVSLGPLCDFLEGITILEMGEERLSNLNRKSDYSRWKEKFSRRKMG
jgi:CTP:molybdopterin cytidylyltransferase MocA